MPSRAAHKPSVQPPASLAGIQPGTSPIPVPIVGGRSPNRARHADQRVTGAPFSPPSGSSYHRGHSRSISQPFASAFSGVGKRRNKSISAEANLDTDDDDDDDDIYVPNPNLISTSPRKGLPRVPLKEELTTGRCMTCNNTVRWPRSLKVFRCTECLTVNDLEPYRDMKDPVNSGRSKRDAKPTQQAIPRKAIPFTIERTKIIIDRCISAHLQQYLGAPPVPPKDGPGASPQTSVKWPDKLPVPDRPSAPRGRSMSSSDTRERAGGDNASFGSSSCPRTPFVPVPPPKDTLSAPKSVEPRAKSRPRDTAKKDRSPYIFRELEDYLISGLKGCDTLNVSFNSSQHVPRFTPSNHRPERGAEQNPRPAQVDTAVELDAKTLLVGDLAENSSWWMVDEDAPGVPNHSQHKHKTTKVVSSRSPRINWIDVDKWYQLILTAGTTWVEKWSVMKVPEEKDPARSEAWLMADLSAIEREFTDSRVHLHRTLLKATESLLKRPRRPLKKPDDIRFLLILFYNPLIHPPSPALSNLTVVDGEQRPSRSAESKGRTTGSKSHAVKGQNGGPGQHPGIVKRILGLLSDLPSDCHHYLVSWFSRFSAGQFEKIVELVGRFVTYRLSRQHARRKSESANDDNYLIPSLSSAAMNTPAELHAAINGINENKQAKKKADAPITYSDDWQIRAAGRVMALLFTANNADVARKSAVPSSQEPTSTSRQQEDHRGHIIPISSFYSTRLDYSNLVVADFEAWESRTTKFSFCQYPFFLSIGAKIQILEHDARRQMEVKAREAFFSSILTRKAVSQYFVLRVRRECLVEDSLQRVSEVLGSSPEEMKKGLRIGFVGEEGVDAGGLRKEWFLLLVREVFDPHHGLFLYDEDSQYCYFNPYCLESSEQFFLVGVVLGLAIYNSIILDIALPPFAFKKLLAGAPQTTGPQPLTTRPTYKCSIDDLAEYRPLLARGLQRLLEFEGDVAETFCQSFVADVERYGEVVSVPLCPGGEKKPVTNANRREFVDLYVHYHLDTAVTRQFEPFRRGFFSVCGGNALSLFRPEEIELLVRGSDEPLDVRSLRAVATYLNWGTPKPESVPVVQWFWEYFERASPEAQRKLLSFVTSSDRIPAMGATSLNIQLMCLGDDSPRFPTAHTCFNRLGLYRYATREKLERLLSEAVLNSEGFGLK
ncbi:HECT-type E3 ubiquitin-protein ligase [Aspergillus mulundensis]|uniref:HECT-type E3 ubiquitin transferase n=1 Tax=Aspergillus mulundensis TaxID=1810919 RepID=A0A3D8R983_9EURO|nr:Uncharacterized protein DSM5745_08123 [Aspergillus mulundensis]RDW70612.1 Uncharacterized protein DSM5745_08123 [Aspergillus mulundensis]